MPTSVLLFKTDCPDKRMTLPWWSYCNAGRLWSIPRWHETCVLGSVSPTVLFRHLPECTVRGLYFQQSEKGGLFPRRLFLLVCCDSLASSLVRWLPFDLNPWTLFFDGFRPSCNSTIWINNVCLSHCFLFVKQVGSTESRSLTLSLAKRALYRLSYTPYPRSIAKKKKILFHPRLRSRTLLSGF